MTRREFVLLAFASLLVPLAAFAVAGPYYFNRPFWSDEVLSWLIASDPSFAHGMAALAGGVDTNAPLVHLLFRGVGQLFGPTAVVYRLTSLAAMALTIVGLYLTLRRSVKASAAAFGCLSFAALPIVIAHTTEARFYAFELAAAAWTNLLIARRGDRSQMRAGPSPVRIPERGRSGSHWLSCCLALTSIALCGVHYFGVIALACIVIADAFREGSTLRSWLERVWPTAAGFAMTLCLVPLVIAQRTAMRDAGGTWVPDTFVKNLRATIDMIFPGPLMWVASIAMLATLIRVGPDRIVSALREHRAILVASLGYLLAMLAFDRLVQPVFVPRYFIVALPAVAAVGAAFASRWPVRVTRFATAGIVVCLVGQWWQIRQRSQAPDGRAAAGLIASVRGVDHSTPIVSDWLGHALPILQSEPDRLGHVAYVADRRLHEVGFDSAIRYEREMAACVQRFYGMPAKATLSEVGRLDRFILLSEYPETVPERYSAYDARRLGTVAFKMTRKTSPDQARAE